MTPASVGPSSQAQQQVHSPSQSAVSPGSSMLVHSPMTAITGSPMTGNPTNTQLTGPSSVGVPMQSPGPAFGWCSLVFFPIDPFHSSFFFD